MNELCEHQNARYNDKKMFVDKCKCHYGSTKFTNWLTNRLKTSNLGEGEQDRQFTYNVTLRHVRVTTVTVEKQ